MAESHKCQICGKPATVHLTQIVGNKIHKIDLCDECAHEKGITDPDGFSLAELAGGAASTERKHSHAESVECRKCGFRAKDFKKMGHFGCPSCYTYFAPIILPMLEGMHRDVTHKGKRPEKSLARISLKEKMRSLEEQLEAAVSEERYEDAARLRDALKMHSSQAQEEQDGQE